MPRRLSYELATGVNHKVALGSLQAQVAELQIAIRVSVPRLVSQVDPAPAASVQRCRLSRRRVQSPAVQKGTVPPSVGTLAAGLPTSLNI